MTTQQISQPITFIAYYTSSKLGKTGLTVTVNVRRDTTTLVSAGSATEIADGLYYYTLDAISTGTAGQYTAVFKTADTTVDQRDLAALISVGSTWVERIDATTSSRLPTASYTAPPSVVDIATAVWANATRTLTNYGTLAADVAAAVWSAGTRTLTSTLLTAQNVWEYATRTLTAFNFASSVTVSSPVTPSGSITIYAGDDYAESESRALSFTITSSLDLAGAMVMFKTPWFKKVGTMSGDTVTVELTNAETALSGRNGKYELEATLANGHVVTLTTGTITIVSQL